MKIYESFLVALERAIEEAGNRYQLSLKMGVNSSTLKRWQEGKNAPMLDMLDKISPYLGGWPFSQEVESLAEGEARKKFLALEAENKRLADENLRLQGRVEAYKELLGMKGGTLEGVRRPA